MSESQTTRREVRIERWGARAFFVVPCPFRVDLPLDMSGCVVSALKDTMGAGYRRPPRGLILASDARGRGAVFVEIEPLGPNEAPDSRVTTLEGETLLRALPGRSSGLRSEVEELVRWSEQLGRGIAAFFVAFVAAEGPRSFRPAALLATLDAGVVEHFEVRSSRRSIVAAAE
jgi:hypothetical protein